MAVREAEADGELQAAAWLRALSFYRYPEERKFAAQVGGTHERLLGARIELARVPEHGCPAEMCACALLPSRVLDIYTWRIC